MFIGKKNFFFLFNGGKWNKLIKLIPLANSFHKKRILTANKKPTRRDVQFAAELYLSQMHHNHTILKSHIILTLLINHEPRVQILLIIF